MPASQSSATKERRSRALRYVFNARQAEAHVWRGGYPARLRHVIDVRQAKACAAQSRRARLRRQETCCGVRPFFLYEVQGASGKATGDFRKNSLLCLFALGRKSNRKANKRTRIIPRYGTDLELADQKL